MNADEIVRALLCQDEYADDDYAWSEDLHHDAANLIESLQAQLTERDMEIERLRKEVASLAIESIEREKTLARLEAEVMVWAKSEQEGRLVVLPCKVGDTVYYPYAGRVIPKRITQYREILRKSEAIDRWYCLEFSNDETFDETDIGKTVFLTREEAEEALKEAQHE